MCLLPRCSASHLSLTAYVHVSVRDHASPNSRGDDDERGDCTNSSQQSPHADNFRQMEGAALTEGLTSVCGDLFGMCADGPA